MSLKKEYKKVFVLSLLSILMISMIAGFVSADSPTDALLEFGRGFMKIFKPLAEALLGSTPGGQELFAKVLFLTIILTVVYAILETMPVLQNNEWVLWVLSISVSILSTRFLADSEWIKTILLPYSTFGIVLVSIIPLLIYFYFVEKILIGSRALRKSAWIIAAVIFMGLYFTRFQELKDSAWVYPVCAIACFIFLFADGTIQKAWRKSHIEAQKEIRMAQARSIIVERRRVLEEGRLNGIINDRDYVIQDNALKEHERRYGIR